MKHKKNKKTERIDPKENTELPLYILVNMVPNSEVFFKYKDLKIKPSRIYTNEKNRVVNVIKENNKIKKVFLRYGQNVFEFDSYRGEYYLADIK